MRVAVVFRRHVDDGGLVEPRKDMCGVFSLGNEDRYIDDRPCEEGVWYHAYYLELDAGLPGAGRVDPDNATTASGADDPVVPSPACFIADDIEC